MGSSQDRSGLQSSRCGFDPSSAQLQNWDLTAQMLPKQQNTGATRAAGDRNTCRGSRLLIQWILHWASTERLLWAGLPWGSDSEESACDAGNVHSIPGSERSPPLQKGMATHSSVLAWRIPWTDEPGGLQSMGSQRVGHDWAANTLGDALC